MIDKTDMETRAIREARRDFAAALTEVGLLAPFHDRSAEDIDRVIGACIEGFQASMQRQSDAGDVPFCGGPMQPDFNQGSGAVYGRAAADPEPLGARINARIDEALEAERVRQRPRDYLGASRIGEPCARRLVYEITHTPSDPGKDFDGRTLRIFAAGHVFEDLAIAWLRQAGFDLRTTDRHGGQFGFETAGGRIRGHVEVIVDGPALGIAWPVLWEHKALKASSWSDTAKKGVQVSKPVYYAQLQVYMAYLGLGAALFTALNKDTCELFHEHVRFDPPTAQALSDKAVDVLRAADAGELLPRIAASSDFYLCRLCPFASHCWEPER